MKSLHEFRTHETDTGSPEVQIAVLTEQINTSKRAFTYSQEGSSFTSWSFKNGW